MALANTQSGKPILGLSKQEIIRVLGGWLVSTATDACSAVCVRRHSGCDDDEATVVWRVGDRTDCRNNVTGDVIHYHRDVLLTDVHRGLVIDRYLIMLCDTRHILLTSPPSLF